MGTFIVWLHSEVAIFLMAQKGFFFFFPAGACLVIWRDVIQVWNINLAANCNFGVTIALRQQHHLLGAVNSDFILTMGILSAKQCRHLYLQCLTFIYATLLAE